MLDNNKIEECEMKLFQFLLLAGLLTVVSCSKGSSTTNKNPEDSTAFNEDEADFIVDADDNDLVIEEEPVLGDSKGSEDVLLEEPVASTEGAIELSSEEATYAVKKGETLMMIAFNIYGDYRRWREIARYNGINGGAVEEGTNLRYQKAVNEFVWNPQGVPYLVKNGDTLGSISNEKYGTTAKWSDIYNNNKPLIKDPNLIFAGFTLYYIAQRDIASE